MKTASVFGVLGVLLSAVVACTTEVAGTNASDGGTNATLNPACSLLATCCDRWPADVRRSCTGPVEANGDGCRALLSNNAAVAAYCPELSVESCSEDLKKVLPEQCGGPGGGAPTGLMSFRASNVGALSAPDGGGALLVEAPSIEGTGVLVAIGGRGADDANAGSGGGAGGGQDGTAAGKDAAQAYSGGGGGAGRIRLNARTQNFKGKLMPNESSTCASKGTLADP